MRFEQLLTELEQITGQSLQNSRIKSVAGGDINSAYHIENDTVSWFIKTNRPSLADMFEAEAAGLKELGSLNALRIPEVITTGQTPQCSYLVLEHIPLQRLNSQSAALMGEQLAALHSHQQAFFGWHTDNTIGSTPQINTRNHDWTDFWKNQRLLAQLQFAQNNGFNGHLQNKGEKLAEKLDAFFSNYNPYPSLLHGDLWGGNAASDGNGNPVIYDPACYYGDREADIAMTELFGGFGNDFYQAYQHHLPLDDGYKTRKTLYNLYHILNHLNLFGGGYQHQAEAMIDSLLSQC